MPFIDGTSLLSSALITSLRLLFLATFKHLPYQFPTAVELRDSYDFIVVGGGGAGCVVASRLSETGANVLLLEAGPSEAPESAIPGLAPLMYGGDRDWHFKGKPQRNAQQGYEGNASNVIAGRTLGGGTSLNGLVYVRGNKRDYDQWSNLGNPGWDYESVLPYFKKSEDFRGIETEDTDIYHGKGGLLTVDKRSFNTEILPAMEGAARELGYDFIDDAGPKQIGFAAFHGTIRDGVRASTSESFLRPAKDRDNLHILTDATVSKVLFQNKQAIGVEFTKGRRKGKLFGPKGQRVLASKEVILSAGALFTPKLLMLSGVGPKDQLERHRIPIVAEVPGVGQNLNDHPTFYLTWKVKDGTSTSFLETLNPLSFIEYIKCQTGQLSTIPGGEVNAWFNLGGDDPDWADVQFSISSMSFALDGGNSIARAVGLKREVFDDVFGPYVNKETLTIAPILSRPKSTGFVTLKSANADDPPLVDPNFFDHPDDMKLAIKAIRKAQRVVATPSVQTRLEPYQLPSILSQCGHYLADSDPYWECYIRHVINSMWHYSGTAKMAPLSDPLGVVTSQLNVRGVSGLRVVDASVMPRVVTANTMGPVVMIAERGADLIKLTWGYEL